MSLISYFKDTRALRRGKYFSPSFVRYRRKKGVEEFYPEYGECDAPLLTRKVTPQEAALYEQFGVSPRDLASSPGEISVAMGPKYGIYALPGSSRRANGVRILWSPDYRQDALPLKHPVAFSTDNNSMFWLPDRLMPLSYLETPRLAAAAVFYFDEGWRSIT